MTTTASRCVGGSPNRPDRPVRVAGRHRPRGRRLLSALLAAVVAGCSVGPDYVRPSAPVPAKLREIEGWKIATPRDDEAKGPWWTVFGDAELDRLAPLVAAENQSVAAAEASYREALALVREARAGLFPVISASLPASRSGGGGGVRTVSQVGGDVSVSWTLDIWGRARRAVEAQEANARQSAAALANTRLLQQSALAQAYIQLRAAEAQAAIMERTVADYRKSLTIIETQYAAGAARKYDVITQRTELLDAEATLIGLRGTRAIAEHAIAVLVGKPPSELTIRGGRMPARVPSVPVRLPSTLLERRPDIAAAEEAMRAANARIGIALTGYYPDLSLGAGAGLSGASLGALDPVWSIGLSLAGPLFDGGRTDAAVEAARQSYAAAVASYRGTILAAFREVEDQLSTIRILRQQRRLYEEQVTLAREALTIAFNEYRAGAQTFETVITAERTLLSAELAAVQVRAQLQVATINLIVALGGGWKSEAVDKQGRATEAGGYGTKEKTVL